MVTKNNKMPIDEKLTKCLESYANILTLDSNYIRQAFWSLYDFYMKVLRLATLNFFYIDAPIFGKHSSVVLSRWNLIKNCITQIPHENKNLEKYDKIINMVQKISNDIRHKDDFIPSRTRLDEIHEVANDFYQWLSSLGKKFITPTTSKGMMKIEKRERFGREEWVLPSNGICPRCGKKPSMIIQHWDREDKPQKVASIQIMCEDCHYLIDTDVITLSEDIVDDK